MVRARMRRRTGGIAVAVAASTVALWFSPLAGHAFGATPVIVDKGATALYYDGAGVSATVNSGGDSDIASVSYGPKGGPQITPAYFNTLDPNGNVTVGLSQLSPNTTYTYQWQVYDQTTGATTSGPSGSFTTISAPTGSATPILPPNNPPANGAFQVCSTDKECLADINGVRAKQENLQPLALPSNWSNLTGAEQMFVFTNMERVARGEAPAAYLVNTYQANLQSAVSSDSDPTVPGGNLGVWAGGNPTPLGAEYGWIYDDGLNSGNVDCTPSSTAGCWGHRDALLSNAATYGNPTQMDAAAGTDSSGNKSYAIALWNHGPAPSASNVVMTWASELQYLGGATPVVTGISPSSGVPGTAVTISGSGLDGASAVDFGSAPAQIVADSASSITAMAPAGSGAVDVTVTTPGGTSKTSPADQFTYVGTGSAFHGMAPVRVADTRPGSGQPHAGQTLAPGGSLTLDLGSLVPSTATGVVLSVTAVDASSAGFLAVRPGTASSGPTESVLNFTAGGPTCTAIDCVASNLVVAGIANGQVTITNTTAAGGSADVVVDLEGWMDPTGATTTGAGHYLPLAPPVRVLDTRCATNPPAAGATSSSCAAESLPAANAADGTMSNGSTLTVATGLSGAQAAVVQLTVTNTTAAGFLSAFAGGTAWPGTSDLNWVPGQTTSVRAIVPVSSNGSIELYLHGGSADVLVDVSGSFADSSASATAGQLFVPLAGSRLVDTRQSAPLGPDSTLKVDVPGLPAGAAGALVNLTVASASAPGYLTLGPSAPTPPVTTSDLNFTTGEIRANADITSIAADHSVTIYNAIGTTQAVLDLFGYFIPAS